MGQEAFVTFGANDSSALGCVVLAHSLRKHGTLRSLVALVTDNINPKIRTLLSGVFDVVQCVPKLNLNDQRSSEGQCFQEVNVELTKLNCWRLTQFTKCVYLDADTLVLQNCDELFDRAELSATPDIGWPDCFNSGVFVFVPSMHTYWDLVNILRQQGSFDGSDQGVLNSYFGEAWRRDLSKRLPFIYNLVSSTSYTYAPAYQQFGKNAKIVHFVGYPKPWSIPWDSRTGKMQVFTETVYQKQFLQDWLDIFYQNVFPLLPEVEQDLGTDAHQFGMNSPTHTSSSAHLSPSTSNQFFSTYSSPENVLDSFTNNITQHVHISSQQLNEHDSRRDPEIFAPSQGHSIVQESKNEPSFLTFGQVQPNEKHKQDEEFSSRHISPSTDATSDPETQSQYMPQETTAEIAVGLVSSVEDAQDSNAGPSVRELTEQERIQAWDEGKIDYQGRDSFDNIWRRLLSHIEDSPVSEDSPVPEVATPADQVCDSKTNIPSNSAANDGANVSPTSALLEPEIGLPGYPIGDYTAMYRWEQGNIDYVGVDSSDRIMRRLDFLIHGGGFQSDQS